MKIKYRGAMMKGKRKRRQEPRGTRGKRSVKEEGKVFLRATYLVERTNRKMGNLCKPKEE